MAWIKMETPWAPGTVQLERTDTTSELVLYPFPTSDPDDPLNWSKWRKTVNFALVCFYVFWTFVQLDIGFTAWGPMQDQLGFSDDDMNLGIAINYGGLAIGCILFIPFVHKYGRRPLYLFSSALQLASVVWQAKVHTFGDLIGSNLISGLGGAISETMVQITIADVFFVHQHGLMNGWYLVATGLGVFLGPVASGYVVESQGWRWMWWWCTIFMSIQLLLVIFLFDESKYIPSRNSDSSAGGMLSASTSTASGGGPDEKQEQDARISEDRASRSVVKVTGSRKTYRQRLALVTSSPGSIMHHFYQPIIVLFTFPAVAYTALTYGIVLSTFAIMTAVQAVALTDAPYNFGAAGVGLMNLAPLIGACLGFVIVACLSDKSIMVLSNRNAGVYEPEMRLWLQLLAIVLLPGSVLIFGIGLGRGAAWPVLAVGFGLFGFNLVIVGDIALAYVTDCYQEIVSDALVGIVFVRNIFSVSALAALTAWVDGMGVQNVHIIMAGACFAVLLLPVPLLIWGKKARISTAERYRRMALREPAHRTLPEDQ
ncbi:major facilitator superfamily domain-containing protein [Phaeosphaeria sp. MPI-PUGE-AT-0046c]|nr:major facilitator superfamily domain-containing protein [Phaeosphaeria sp. MPI-PUGE-AT-0046c]